LDRETDVTKRINGARNVLRDLRSKPEFLNGELDARDRNDFAVCVEILARNGDSVSQPFLDQLHAKPQGRALDFEPMSDDDRKKLDGELAWVMRPKVI